MSVFMFGCGWPTFGETIEKFNLNAFADSLLHVETWSFSYHDTDCPFSYILLLVFMHTVFTSVVLLLFVLGLIFSPSICLNWYFFSWLSCCGKRNVNSSNVAAHYFIGPKIPSSQRGKRSECWVWCCSEERIWSPWLLKDHLLKM